MMGDFWNDSGFYEQHEIRRTGDLISSDWLITTDMLPEQDGRAEDEWNRDTQQPVAIGGNATGSLHRSVNDVISEFLNRPLLQIGRLPVLLTGQIIVALPLALAALYCFRSLSHWLMTILVTLLLISASPLLIVVLRVVFLIVLFFAVLLVLVILIGSIFHWWHFTLAGPTLQTKPLFLPQLTSPQ